MLNHHREMATNLTFNISEKYRLDAGKKVKWKLFFVSGKIRTFFLFFFFLHIYRRFLEWFIWMAFSFYFINNYCFHQFVHWITISHEWIWIHWKQTLQVIICSTKNWANTFWYKFQLNFRTILDSFDLSLVWILLFGTIFHIIALSRNLFGPLPEFLCWIQAFTRNSTGVAACLMFDILIIFRVRLYKL